MASPTLLELLELAAENFAAGAEAPTAKAFREAASRLRSEMAKNNDCLREGTCVACVLSRINGSSPEGKT